MIVIVDYGVGNLRSVENMLRKVGAPCAISSEPNEIRAADKIILPGVGHFAYGMNKLRESGFYDDLNWFACDAKRPVLGICLGAQILGRGSDEAPGTEGLGWIDMRCERFPNAEGLPVPHMVWNTVALEKDCALIPEVEDDTRYYFVHSYRMVCADEESVVANTQYGLSFTSVVRNDAGNIYGTQFHPEKSHRFGMALLTAYAAL